MDVGTNSPVPGAELSLGPDARSAGVARRFLTATLGNWRVTAYEEDAVLLLSELVANAALHANTPMLVRIELQPGFLRLAVTDASPRQPVVRHYSDEATTGRGLGLVDALALRWGIDPHAEGGKTVWADVVAHRARRISDETTVDLSAFPDLEEVPLGRTQGDEATTTFLQAA